jgi:hypothetical protein
MAVWDSGIDKREIDVIGGDVSLGYSFDAVGRI